MSFTIPDIEEFEVPEDTATANVPIETHTGALSIGILGSGQCGGKLAEAFVSLGYTKAISINTTANDHNSVPKQVLLSLEGMSEGAGKNPETARRALEVNTQDVFNAMVDTFGKVDHIFIAAGLGGGTGSGTVLGLVSLAKKYLTSIGNQDSNKSVGVLAVLPTIGESGSKQVSANAKSALRELSTLADTNQIGQLVLMDNERIRGLLPNVTLGKFYPTVNMMIAQLIDVFNSIANTPSEFATFDPADWKSLLTTGGHMIFGVSVIKEYAKREGFTGLSKTFSKTLLSPDFELSTTQKAAAIVVVGQEIVDTQPGLMNNIEAGFDTLTSITNSATLFRGINAQEGSSQVRIYAVLAGLRAPNITRFNLR